MTGAAARFLLSPAGREAADIAARHPGDSLRAGAELRRRYPDTDPAYLAAAVELSETRRRASGSYDRAGDLFFTREGLEMATGPRAAAHRAERFRGLGTVVDACSGIGGDAMVLAPVAHRLICVDTDPAHLLFCVENCRIAAGVLPEALQGDIRNLLPDTGADGALFIDPARRRAGRRTSGLTDMEPPIGVVLDLLGRAGRGAAKLSPALDPQALAGVGELEWVSDADGLKEAVLWYGDLRRAAATVTLLHRGLSLNEADFPTSGAPVTGPGGFLYEPDPALIRSGLLSRAAAAAGMTLLDEYIAYCTADAAVQSPLFAGYRILESDRFGMKRLDRMLASYGAGRVTIKKRGFPKTPEEVIAGLRLRGDRDAVVVIARIGDGHRMFLVEPLGG